MCSHLRQHPWWSARKQKQTSGTLSSATASSEIQTRDSVSMCRTAQLSATWSSLTLPSRPAVVTGTGGATQRCASLCWRNEPTSLPWAGSATFSSTTSAWVRVAPRRLRGMRANPWRTFGCRMCGSSWMWKMQGTSALRMQFV